MIFIFSNTIVKIVSGTDDVDFYLRKPYAPEIAPDNNNNSVTWWTECGFYDLMIPLIHQEAFLQGKNTNCQN